MPAPVHKSALVRAKLKFFRGGRRYRVATIALLMVAVFLLGADVEEREAERQHWTDEHPRSPHDSMAAQAVAVGKPDDAAHQMPFFDTDAQQAQTLLDSLPQLPATDKPLSDLPAPLPESPATDKPLPKAAEWEGGDGDATAGGYDATAGGGDADAGPLELAAWTDEDKPVSVTYDGGGDKVEDANYQEEDDGDDGDKDEDEDEEDDDDDDAPAETKASGGDAAATPTPAAAPNIFQQAALAAERAQVQEAVMKMQKATIKMQPPAAAAATMQVPIDDAVDTPALPGAGGRGAAAADGLPPLQPTVPPKPPALKPRKPRKPRKSKGIKGIKGIKGYKNSK